MELAGELGAGRRAERWEGQSELVGQRSHAVCFSQQAEVAEAISAVGGVSLGGGGLSLQEARVDGWAEARGGRSSRGREVISSQRAIAIAVVVTKSRAGQGRAVCVL